MELLTGYLWKIDGEWERTNEHGGTESQCSNAKFVIYCDSQQPGWYGLTEGDEPELAWGAFEAFIPQRSRIGFDLPMLDADGYAGYTVWIAKADGTTNEVTLLSSGC